ncbi:MAG: DUF4097 family beta strand repeat-containing protein, partial [Chloroflexota bacterium]
MPEREAPFSEKINEQAYTKAVPVDLERLRLVKIVNVSGRTYISGSSDSQIKIRTNARNTAIVPNIELKNEGREVEITVIPGEYFNFGGGNRPAYDPDIAFQQPQGDFDAGEEPQPWEFSGEGTKRKEYGHQRGENCHGRHEFREEVRRFKEQARAAARQFKEQSPKGRGFWSNFDFDTETFTEIAKGIGKGVSEIFEALGDLYIEVPAGVELEVKSLSGMVEILNIKGFCRVGNSSGVIALNRVTGGLQLKGMSGKVVAQELAGKVTAKVMSGSVQLLNCHLTALDLSINSGNLLVETTLVEPNEGDYKISSTSGRVQLRLPKETRASIDCRTLSGRIILPPEVGQVEH